MAVRMTAKAADKPTGKKAKAADEPELTLVDAMLAYRSAEAELKDADKKDKKAAAKSLKDAKKALEVAIKKAKPQDFLAAFVSTEAKESWLVSPPEGGSRFQNAPELIPLPDNTITAGRALGLGRIHPGTETVIRGGLLGGWLVASTPTEASGIAIQQPKPPIAYFSKLKERVFAPPEELPTPKMVDGAWSFQAPGPGIFLISSSHQAVDANRETE